MSVLQHVHQNTSSTARQVKSEFESVIRDLDEADARLGATLEQLSGTFVEAKLRPEGEEKRNLLDFVDEGAWRVCLAQSEGFSIGLGRG